MARRSPRSAATDAKRRRRRSWRSRRDWGGILAKILCAVFAVVGVIPLAAGALVRIDRIQAWAAERTAAIIADQLELDASYELELQPWPLMLSMEDVVLRASDGGSPFLEARRVIARPRIFSLLAGKVDLGAVEIEEPKLRAVIEDGQLRNLHYRVPESDDDGSIEQLPISSVSFTNGFVDVVFDGTNVRSEEIDVDVTIRRSPAGTRALVPRHAFDVAIRAGATTIDRIHPSTSSEGIDDVDEDALCRLEIRASIDSEVLVRRLSLEGAADLDPGPDTRPPCDVDPNDWRRLALTLEGIEIHFDEQKVPASFDGRFLARLPVGIAHRFVPLPPTAGWVELRLDELHFRPGMRLPEARGHFRGADLSIDTKIAARSVAAQIHTEGDRLVVRDLDVGWGGGRATIPEATVEPFAEGLPLRARDALVRDVTLRELLDDVAVHPDAHVDWSIDRAAVAHFGGTLVPLSLSGPMVAETTSFAVYDRSAAEEPKRKLMGVERGVASGIFRVEEEGIVLSGYSLNTPRSRVFATVSIGFDDRFGLTVGEGSTVDLADISPLIDIPIGGKVKLTARGMGTTAEPRIEGDISIDGFHFGGFPLGNLERAQATFVPLDLELTDARLAHGKSVVDVPAMRIAFDDGDADVVLDGTLDSSAHGLGLHDLFEMVRLLPPGGEGVAFCQGGHSAEAAAGLADTAWCGVDGVARGSAEFHYVLGGRRDSCGTGRLEVRARMQLQGLGLFGMHYPQAELDAQLRWDDFDAGDRGMALDLYSGVLRKGSGTIVGSGTLRHGAVLQADVVGTAIPLDEIEAFRKVFGLTADERAERNVAPDARLSFVAQLGGTLDRVTGKADIDLSEMRIGPDRLPASRLVLDILPAGPEPSIRATKCGHAADPRAQFAAAPGVFRLDGQLFGGQVELDDVEITQERDAILSGRVVAKDLDLGTFANLLPGVAFSRSAPDGRLSAVFFIDELPLSEPGLAEMRIKLQGAEITQDDNTLRIPAIAQPLLLSGDALRIPPVPIDLRLRSGLRAHLSGQGSITHLSKKPELDLRIDIEPIDLERIGVDIPQIQRAAGILGGRLAIKGPLSHPDVDGRIELSDGMLRVEGLPVGLDDVEVVLDVGGGEIRILRASARVGTTGRISASGNLPLDGLTITGADTALIVSDVKIPLAEGIRLTADARLRLRYELPRRHEERSLPHLSGTVTLKRFAYTRPMAFRLDLDSITGRGRSEVDTYDPENDTLSFDVLVVSPQPVRISNNLLDMHMEVQGQGLRVSGTDQRFGAQGSLRIEPASKLFLQGHDFGVRDGRVVFDNPTRIAPRLDLTASTEYRRYAAVADAAATSTDVAGSTAGGRWRILMHAYGDLDAPEVRFSSDPPLSQEDIVLLLQVGMTRAELDRGLAGSLAQTVGLEALSAVIGLDQAVRKTVPLIDEFRFGSQYSSRTGRPEPTVTLGKRITDDVRATVTSTVGEEREIRSNIEWRLKGGVSVQGGYDNVNDVSSSVLGNVGAGLRWRLEFE